MARKIADCRLPIADFWNLQRVHFWPSALDSLARRSGAETARPSTNLPDCLQRVVVENVLVDALNFVRVKIIHADVKIERDDGHFVAHQDRFGLLEQFLARLQIGLLICPPDEFVVSRVFPAGAVVAVVAGEHFQKRVRVIIIADPTGTREVKVQMGLRGIKDFRLQWTQIHLHAEFIMPHLLQFDGNIFMNFVSPAGRSAEHIFKAGKPLTGRITGLRQQFSRPRRIISQPFGRSIMSRAIRHEMRCGLFSRPGDFFDDAFLVNRQRERLADARVVEGFPGHVETDEISHPDN